MDLYYVQQLVIGLSQGMTYALVAIGFTLIFGVLNAVNFAHSEVYTLGAVAGLFLIGASSAPLAVVILFVVVVGALTGLGLERLAFKPFRRFCDEASLKSRAMRESTLMSSLAVSIIVREGLEFLARDRLLAKVADRVALWRDRFEPAKQTRRHLGLFPWLGSGFELQERGKDDGDSDLNRVHLLNHAASLSFGSIASDIPAISAAAERLAGTIIAQLFVESFDVHKQSLEAWEVEWELEKTPYLYKRQ